MQQQKSWETVRKQAQGTAAFTNSSPGCPPAPLLLPHPGPPSYLGTGPGFFFFL